MPAIIETDSITKRFEDVVAVNGVDLTVEKGEIFGLLGPNAAGKSTTIRLLSGIIALDGGSANVLGYDLATQTEQIKQRIGYVAQSFALYPELTAAENLTFYSALYQGADGNGQKELLESFGLSHYRNHRAAELSGGYKRRLSIACALAHDPELIFLDEPTAGIDPVTRKDLWDDFYNLAAAGKTLFVTTHYMEEAERCNRLAFIHKGKLVATGSPAAIRESLHGKMVYACRVRHDPAMVQKIKSIDGVIVLNRFGEQLRIVTESGVDEESLRSAVGQSAVESDELRIVPTTIEDAFITLTDGEDRS